MKLPHRKLFTPGPIEVHPDILAAMATPMINHRSKDYEVLHAEVKRKLHQLLLTKNSIFLITSSSTGAMEAAMRNFVGRKVLTVTCGAFGERWHGIAKANERDSEILQGEWGKANRPEHVDERLKKGGFDAVAVVLNESSTGVLNPVREIGAMLRAKYPDVLLLVDAVSAMAGVRIEPEAWNVDFVFAGVQKAFGVPPGLTVAVASDRALERAKSIKNRGYYFDMVKYRDIDAKNQTPETPSISHINALDAALDKFLARGVDGHFARILGMAEHCRAWARRQFGLYPEKGFESVTLTCVANTRKISVPKLLAEMEKRGVTLAAGYGRLKDDTFRIAHMGEITMDDLQGVLSEIDALVASGALA